MTMERDPMTMNEISVLALGVEERSDEAPRWPRKAGPGSGGRGQTEAACSATIRMILSGSDLKHREVVI